MLWQVPEPEGIHFLGHIEHSARFCQQATGRDQQQHENMSLHAMCLHISSTGSHEATVDRLIPGSAAATKLCTVGKTMLWKTWCITNNDAPHSVVHHGESSDQANDTMYSDAIVVVHQDMKSRDVQLQLLLLVQPAMTLIPTNPCTNCQALICIPQ